MSPYYPLYPPIGQPLTVLSSADSTNNYAMAQVREGLAGHGAAYFALEQTAGRGQRGKQWITEPGQNIMISIVTTPGEPFIQTPFAFSASIALACYDFFKTYGSPDETRIKWPNDLYWQDRKAGGVLIESLVVSHQSSVGRRDRESSDVSREAKDLHLDRLQSDQSNVFSEKFHEKQEPLTSDVSRLTPEHSPLTTHYSTDATSTTRYVIVGIGININQTSFDPSLKNPVSLKQITGKTWDPIALAKELCEAVDHRYKQFLLLKPEEIVADYQSVLYKYGQTVRLKKDNASFETTIKGVSNEGNLLTQDVIERNFRWGEVEWVV